MKRLALILFLLPSCADEPFEPQPEDFDGYWAVADPFVVTGVDDAHDEYFWDPGNAGTARLTLTSPTTFEWSVQASTIPVGAPASAGCTYHGRIEDGRLIFDYQERCDTIADDGTTWSIIAKGVHIEMVAKDTIVMDVRERWEWSSNGGGAEIETDLTLTRTDNPDAWIYW